VVEVEGLLSTLEGRGPFDKESYEEADTAIKLSVPSSYWSQGEAEAVVNFPREALPEGRSFPLLYSEVRHVVCMACKPPFS